MATVEGYIYLLRDSERSRGEFLLGKSPLQHIREDLRRVNAPWNEATWHSLSFVNMRRTLDIEGSFVEILQSLSEEFGMVIREKESNERVWLDNLRRLPVDRLLANIRAIIDRRHVINRLQGDTVVDFRGSEECPEQVRVEWKCLGGD